jgi:hypothetical protein
MWAPIAIVLGFPFALAVVLVACVGISIPIPIPPGCDRGPPPNYVIHYDKTDVCGINWDGARFNSCAVLGSEPFKIYIRRAGRSEAEIEESKRHEFSHYWCGDWHGGSHMVPIPRR